jgi:hypothetical protein
MERLGLLFAVMLAVGTAACGDDDTPGGGTDSGPGGTDSGPGGTDSGPGGTDSGPGGTDAGPGEDAGPGVDAGDVDAGMMMASEEAMTFCTAYETTCTYGAGNRYADEGTCLTEYDGAVEGCVDCIEDHLVNAMDGMGAANTHCPHATTTNTTEMMGPCGGPCS